ncbi:hypothetical protein GH816_02045 [Betaproteobacteria bacterium LSUCC0115]|nr:hypothetical protein [Burkholderiales bacterium LSUCC0115]
MSVYFNALSFTPDVNRIGTLGLKELAAFGSAATLIPFSATGDLTGDGRPEVVISGWSFNPDLNYYRSAHAEYVVLSSQSDGSWRDITSIFSKSPFVYGAGSIQIADFNSDGIKDVFFAPYMEQAPNGDVYSLPATFLLSDQGQLRWSQSVTPDQISAHGSGLVDIDGDGIPEVLVTSYWTPPLNDPTSENIQPGYYKFEPSLDNFRLISLPALYSASGIAGGDLNGDGRADIVATDQYFNSQVDMLALLQRGAGDFSDSAALSSHVIPIGNGYFDVYPDAAGGVSSNWTRATHSTRAYLYDIDGDQDLDVVTTGHIFPGHGNENLGMKAALSVFKNDSGKFSEATNEVIPYQSLDHAGAYHLDYVDINNDGHKDLVSYSHGSWDKDISALQILINNGLNHYYESDPQVFIESYKTSLTGIQGGYPFSEIGMAIPVVIDNRFSLLTEIHVNPQLSDGSYDWNSSLAYLYSFDYGEIFSGPNGINPALHGVPGFSEIYYLSTNTHVQDEIDSGAFGSGLDHYIHVGMQQGLKAFAHGTKVIGLSESVDKVNYVESSQETEILVGDALSVSFVEGLDILESIERIEFSDISIAFDLNGNAGQVAKLLGAVFGADSVGNAEYVGIGLDLLDAGMSYTDLAALAVSVNGKSSSTDVCTLLWENVIGTPATSADIAPFKAMLDGNQLSIGQLTTLAADTSFNMENIDLVGLAQTGLEYL